MSEQPVEDSFGHTASHRMPRHLFGNAVFLDHATAVPANTTRQNFSVCPRYWYVDAEYECSLCKKLFTWKAAEQKAWFEDYHFWIDAHPSHCKACRQSLKRLTEVRKEYDEKVSAARHGTPEEKRHIMALLDELALGLGPLPDKMIETRRLFEKQAAQVGLA